MEILRVSVSPIEIRWFFDRVWVLLPDFRYLAGVAVLTPQSSDAEDPIVGGS